MLRLMPRPITLFLIAALCVPLGLAAVRSVVAQSGELLTNPGFEDPFIQEGSADVFIANGWRPWYVVPDGVTYPTKCSPDQPTCRPYQVPTYRPSQPQDHRIPPRALAGNSQQWGASYAVYIAGVYQQVPNVAAGTQLRFSANLQGFNCDDDRGCFGGAGRYGYSYEPGDMQTRVGIDPTGGTNAFSPNVVWSSYANPLDAFVLQEVEAVAPGGTVTVFVWSSPTFPEKHTDIYVDNASLIAVGQGQEPTGAPTQPPQATAAAGTPGPTLTLSPNATTYTVTAGDTLYAIALKYNLTLDQLLALNPGLTRESVIQVGQVINVAGPVPTPGAVTAQPTAAPPPSPTAGPTAAPTAAVSTAAPAATPTATLAISATAAAPTPTRVVSNSGLCLLAFDDQNGNGTRDPGEALVAGAKFEIKSADGQLSTTYTTDGVKEPHCLSDLTDGRYSIKATLPADRAPTTDTAWEVSLLSGTNVSLALGTHLNATPTVEPTSAPTPAAAVQSTRQTGSSSASLALLGGGVLILLAGAALFLALRSRSKAA